jgi:hypothetical protein
MKRLLSKNDDGDKTDHPCQLIEQAIHFRQARIHAREPVLIAGELLGRREFMKGFIAQRLGIRCLEDARATGGRSNSVWRKNHETCICNRG